MTHPRHLAFVDSLVEEPLDEVEAALDRGQVEARLPGLRVRVAIADVAVLRDAVGEADEVVERGRRARAARERPSQARRGVDERQCVRMLGWGGVRWEAGGTCVVSSGKEDPR